jgi:hypothetical protein
MKVHESLVSTKKTTSRKMLGCYILCSESLVGVNQLTIEVEVDWQQVKGLGSQPGKFEVEDIDKKSTKKRLKIMHATIN